MDFLSKSISGSFQNINPYITSTDQELFVKSYSERDIFHISNKFISKDEWDSIFNNLSRSTNFHTFSISGINIESYGLKRVAEIISVNTYIKTLKLEWNYLNEYNEEFNNLCEVIARGKSIVYLHLNNNKLNSLQMPGVCNVIKSNTAMLLCDLRWNEIGNDGGKEISNALSGNTVLQECNVTGNKISPEVLFEINDKISRNKNYAYNINFHNKSTKNSPRFDYSKLIATSALEQKNESRFENTNLYYDGQEKYLNDKEKELTNEYKARYDSQLLQTTAMEKAVKEMEISHNTEKTRYDELKTQLTKDLQYEKDLRANLEDEVCHKNEEFLKKEMQMSQMINELQLKITYITQEKADLINEIEMCKAQVDRIKESYEEKYKLLETHYAKNNEFMQNNFNGIKLENEKNRREYIEEYKRICEETDKKYKTLDDNFTQTKELKDELEKSYLILKKEIAEFKIAKESEITERETRLTGEHNRKLDQVVRDFEMKFKNFQSTRDELKEKNSRLTEEYQKLKVTHAEESYQLGRELETTKGEIINQSKIINNFNLAVSKYNVELAKKEEMINKLKNDISDMGLTVKNHFDQNSGKIEELMKEYVHDKLDWAKEKQDYIIQVEKLTDTVEELKFKLEKKRTDKYSLNEAMKKHFSKLIDEKLKEIKY